MATYIQPGIHIDYTPASDVTVGNIIAFGTKAAVVDPIATGGTTLAAGTLGSLSLEGVYTVAQNATPIAYTAGARVKVDIALQTVTSAAVGSNVIDAGFATADAAATAGGLVYVKLGQ